MPNHPLVPLLTRLAQHSPLGDEDRLAIRALPLVLRDLDADSHIVREGETPSHCAILLSGFAYRQKTTGDGARQIVSLHVPGEALDFQHLYLDETNHGVQMMTRGSVAMIARAPLQRLVRTRPGVGRAMMVQVLVEASILREWVLTVGRRGARARVAHLLCELAVRTEAQGLAANGGLELPMSQEQLGDATALTAVHVNRTLKSLEADGLIVRNRRHVRIPDWERLAEAGDFSDRYLHPGPQTAADA